MTIGPETKAKVARWCDDLEQDHLQTGGRLHRVNHETGEHRYCCLGRLCEVAVEDGVPLEVSVRASHDVPAFDDVSYNGTFGYLPGAVYEWLGVGPEPSLNAYAHMNDAGYTFREIAERIRDDFGIEAGA